MHRVVPFPPFLDIVRIEKSRPWTFGVISKVRAAFCRFHKTNVYNIIKPKQLFQWIRPDNNFEALGPAKFRDDSEDGEICVKPNRARPARGFYVKKNPWDCWRVMETTRRNFTIPVHAPSGRLEGLTVDFFFGHFPIPCPGYNNSKISTCSFAAFQMFKAVFAVIGSQRKARVIAQGGILLATAQGVGLVLVNLKSWSKNTCNCIFFIISIIN